jgi:cytochrome oxidase assembly protein ShyY1
MRWLLLVCGVVALALLFAASYLYVTINPAPIDIVDFPEITEHGWPLPWLMETEFLGPGSRAYYAVAWSGLLIDSFVFILIASITAVLAVPKAAKKRRTPFK